MDLTIRNRIDNIDIIGDVYKGLRDLVRSSNPAIEEVLEKVFLLPGKGLRPALMALTAELAGGSWEQVRNAAISIEAIHIASLIHDDLIDNEEIRRDAKALNTRFDDKTAVLFGDLIFLEGLEIADTLHVREAAGVVRAAVRRMLEGEILQSFGEYAGENGYLEIIGNKTASLFAATGELGVMLSGKDQPERSWASQTGELLGIAFQITDDVLDFRGEIETSGKGRGIDFMEGRSTLPLIHAFETLDDSEKANFLKKEHNPSEIVQLVEKKKGMEYSLGRAVFYAEEACKTATRFGGVAAENIRDFAVSILDRAS